MKELKMVRDAVDNQFLNNKYYFKGNFKKTEISAYLLSKKDLEQEKLRARRLILESTRMPEEDQVKYIKQLESYNYEDDKYFSFNLYLPEPILNEDQKFDFKIQDVSNKNYIDSIYGYTYKFMDIGLWGWSTYGYGYTWLIKANKQITKKNFVKDDMPVELIVIFPNDSTRSYSILWK